MLKRSLLLITFGVACMQVAVVRAQAPAVVQPVITPPPQAVPPPTVAPVAPAVVTPVAPAPPAPAARAPDLTIPKTLTPPPTSAMTVPPSARPAQPAWWGTPLQYDTYDGETQNFGLRPTATIRVNNFEAPTPTTIIGAHTVTTPRLRDMLASPNPPLLIDVLGGNPQDSLPGAILFTQAGLGNSYSDQVQQHLAAHLTQLTHGNLRAPIVFFCLSKTCWLSHNAAVRAVSLGYTNVLWYRGGRDAWIAAGLPMEPAVPTPF
jgi:PQQ-dependent catabolism-associated CXXCW motif protein